MTNTTNYSLPKNETTDDTLVALVTNQNTGMNIIDSTMKANELAIDIARTAKTSTGTATAYALDTDGTFDLTRDGNILTFIPHITNTGACTINVDGQGAITFQKPNDVGTLVALEAGDILLNRPTQLVRGVGSNVFILRPSGGGSNIKSIQSGEKLLASFTTTTTVAITPIDVNKSIIIISNRTTTGGDSQSSFITAKITNNTTITFERNSYHTLVDTTICWQVIEFNNVKSKQSGNHNFVFNVGVNDYDVAISTVNVSKCIAIVTSFVTVSGSEGSQKYTISVKLQNSTTVRLSRATSGTAVNSHWQVVEFK